MKALAVIFISIAAMGAIGALSGDAGTGVLYACGGVFCMLFAGFVLGDWK